MRCFLFSIELPNAVLPINPALPINAVLAAKAEAVVIKSRREIVRMVKSRLVGGYSYREIAIGIVKRR
jgi:hypothetical protein